MKRKLLSSIGILSLLLFPGVIQAQNDNTVRADWYNLSPDDDGVYGVGVDKAYRFLQGKKQSYIPLVAIIGSGMDIEHEALAKYIWVNPTEKEDGIDNDKNGYVDDIHGWNFLGSSSGETMEFTMRTGDREFFRLKDAYADYININGKWFKYIDGKRVEVSAPADMDVYNYYREQVIPESKVAGSYGGFALSYLLKEYALKFNEELKAKYPGREDYTAAEFASLWDRHGVQDDTRNIAITLMGYYFHFGDIDSWNTVFDHYSGNNQYDQSRKEYEENLTLYGSDKRADFLRDNPDDIRDRSYGNNQLLTPFSTDATMMAGVVTGERGIDGRNSPISNARILPLVAVAGAGGEPYIKDIVLAMEYAMDKGADIIILPKQNTIYTPNEKKWMSEALRKAERKGVLVIVGTSESSIDLDQVTYYPNRFMAGEPALTNLIVVSPSDKDGNPTMKSNYGKKGLDLYAPGVSILSANVGDIYQKASGMAFASATTSGVAALVKSYYPKLTGTQIRDILLKSVTRREDTEVEKGIRINNRAAQDLFLFDQLSLSGGIVNAYQAVRIAGQTDK